MGDLLLPEKMQSAALRLLVMRVFPLCLSMKSSRQTLSSEMLVRDLNQQKSAKVLLAICKITIRKKYFNSAPGASDRVVRIQGEQNSSDREQADSYSTMPQNQKNGNTPFPPLLNPPLTNNHRRPPS